MHSLLLTAPRQLEWLKGEERKLKSNEVRVETLASSISIGSEIPQYEGRARLAHKPTYPMMTGYENVGRIIEVGESVEALEVGQRVIAFYGYRTQAIITAGGVIPVDDDISDKEALLTILSCDVSRGIRKLKPYPEEAVLITGCGAIGLLATFVIKAYGVSSINAVDVLDSRRQLAFRLGASATASPEELVLMDTSYDLGIECSSYQIAFELLQSKMIANGRITILADGNREPLILTPDFHRNELTVYASSDGWNYSKHARWFFDVVRHTTSPLEELFDLTIRPSEIADTFASISMGTLKPIKVFITDFR